MRIHLLSTARGLENEQGELYAIRLDFDHVIMTVDNDYIHEHFMNAQLSIVNAFIPKYEKLEVYKETIVIEACVEDGIELDVEINEYDFADFVRTMLESINAFSIEFVYQSREIYAVSDNSLGEADGHQVRVFIGETQGNDSLIYRQRYYPCALVKAVAEFFDRQPVSYVITDEDTVMVVPRRSLADILNAWKIDHNY